ncbi:hypothetical protein MUJ63_07020 [Lachnospiraceae bacterium NSJ-143]|mgnify:CR=1 FL=1|nr:hypothetical protein [Lachnospiraceae bacterium NSJ-143]
MKKLLFVFIMCFSALIICNAAYAKEAESDVFEVTSGLDFDKDKVSTFDSTKTISGTAIKDTGIKIEVYLVNAEDMELTGDYELTVGVSGIFTQTIELSLGENYVVVSSGEGEENKAEITVNRKNEAVKKALEQGVYLP